MDEKTMNREIEELAGSLSRCMKVIMTTKDVDMLDEAAETARQRLSMLHTARRYQLHHGMTPQNRPLATMTAEELAKLFETLIASIRNQDGAIEELLTLYPINEL